MGDTGMRDMGIWRDKECKTQGVKSTKWKTREMKNKGSGDIKIGDIASRRCRNWKTEKVGDNGGV